MAERVASMGRSHRQRNTTKSRRNRVQQPVGASGTQLAPVPSLKACSCVGQGMQAAQPQEELKSRRSGARQCAQLDLFLLALHDCRIHTHARTHTHTHTHTGTGTSTSTSTSTSTRTRTRTRTRTHTHTRTHVSQGHCGIIRRASSKLAAANQTREPCVNNVQQRRSVEATREKGGARGPQLVPVGYLG